MDTIEAAARICDVVESWSFPQKQVNRQKARKKGVAAAAKGVTTKEGDEEEWNREACDPFAAREHEVVKRSLGARCRSSRPRCFSGAAGKEVGNEGPAPPLLPHTRLEITTRCSWEHADAIGVDLIGCTTLSFLLLQSLALVADTDTPRLTRICSPS
jgi:hypothetical protein